MIHNEHSCAGSSEMDEMDDNISVKSFSSASFEPDLSDLNNEGKKLDRRSYMKEYMRDYRLKQKEKAEEQKHLIIIRNQLCSHQDVERLLLNALHRIILIINDCQEHLTNERIERLNDRSNDIIKYGELIIETFDDLRKILMK